MRAWLLLAAAALTTIAVAGAYASASSSGQVLRPLAAVAVKEPLGLGEAQAPLQPLTSVSCGDAVAVVYGPEARKPLVVVVYAAGPGALHDATKCPGRLAPCLTAAGHPEAVKELRKALLGLATATTTTKAAARVEALTATPRAAGAAAPATGAASPAKPVILPSRVRGHGSGGGAGWAARTAAVLVPAAAAAGAALLWARRSRGTPWRS